MVSRADLNTPRPVAPVDATAPVIASTDARQQVLQRLTQIAIGRQLQAEVLSRFDDGTYMVRVADTPARMALPSNTRVGDALWMTFIAKEPRPTFLLGQQPGSSSASLSSAARMIDQFLQAAQQDGAPTSIAGKAPLLAATSGMNAEQLANDLHGTLSSSGLFYESHLQDWVNGKRPLTDIQREPQAHFKNETPASASDTTPSPVPQTELGHLANHMRELGNGAQSLLSLMQEAQTQQSGSPSTDADVLAQPQPNTPPTIDTEAARLVNLQLNALEHHQLRWQGELWPGQEMEWEVTEDTPQGHAQDGAPSSWTSVVRFQLPTLGELSATVRLMGERVHIQVNTTNEETASSLRTYGPLLADALAAAGSPLDSLLVKQDETR